MSNFKILMFYKYITIDDPESLKNELLEYCRAHSLNGKIYVSVEGINGTVSGREGGTDDFKSFVKQYTPFTDLWFKEDNADRHAYSSIYVRVKKELVNSGLNVNPYNGGKRLTPEQLLKFYEEGKDFVIVDARNWYESKIGHFKNAITPEIKNFRQWAEVVESLKEYKNKTVITYCTGGIRCEKASAYMVEQGFEDVYQLDGGIVNFIQQFPDTYWQGGMFVFDERKVVEPNSIKELKYTAGCYFCSKPTAYYINCHNVKCDKIIITCHDCKTRNEYCCSEECKNAPEKRLRYYD